MIEIKKLSKSYDQQVIFKDVSLSVGKEIVGLIGANGAGKTTLLKCILGLTDYTGDISIANINTKKNPTQYKRHLAYIPQSFPTWQSFKISEIVSFFCKLKQVPIKKGQDLLERFDLSGHAHKKITLLSGGMKQKLSIVIALLGDPQVLFLDEPTSGLDAWATKEILSIMTSWKETKSVLFTSHRLEEVKAVSDRIIQVDNAQFVSPNFEELAL